MTPLQPLLIVEDNDIDYKAMKRALNKTNFINPIHRCEDGQEALDYLSNQGKYSDPNKFLRPGLILLDLNMPGMDGRRVLEKIKSDQKLKSIPIIILTSSDDERDIKKCYEIGANTYVQKPVELDNLFEAIKRLQEYWFGFAILPKDTKEENA